MGSFRKVVVLGLDGFDPKIAERLLSRGELPHLRRLSEQGGYSRLATTTPAQTPVAWSTFATGTNPGGHGVFDFLRRDPQTNLPDAGLFRFEQKNSFVAPRATNLRRGTPLWAYLSEAGVSSTVLRCPCTFPPDEVRGRLLAGVGVPDLRGTFSSGTFFTAALDVESGEGEMIVPLREADGGWRARFPGPRQAKGGESLSIDLTFSADHAARLVTIRLTGHSPVTLRVGEWSDWIRIGFKAGLFHTLRGLIRFFVVRLQPQLEVYSSPIQFDPESPRFPISYPADYAAQLARDIGPFHTAGMAEDHGGLNNDRFDEQVYLEHCHAVMAERERMMMHELNRTRDGFVFCLFDTPDRLQHMFWRFEEPDHPANAQAGCTSVGNPPGTCQGVIEDHYRACDAVVGRAMEFADDRTLFMVLSDHGFASFRRGVHLNGWLYDNGLLTMKSGSRPGPDALSFFRGVDWSTTKAYSLGLSGIYINLRGREAHGGVPADEAPGLKAAIAENLSRLKDPANDVAPVRSVLCREQVYAGPYVSEAPDLLVNYNLGYRVSWSTALGGVPAGTFEDNTKKWSGDHIIDPALVPGVLFMNQRFRGTSPGLVDLAPTILDGFGVARGPAMEGRVLI